MVQQLRDGKLFLCGIQSLQFVSVKEKVEIDRIKIQSKKITGGIRSIYSLS